MVVAVVSLATGAVPACAQIPANWDRGFNFTGWWHTDYATPQAAKSLVALKATGANSVALTPTWYQATKTSTVIAPDLRSPDDAAIRVIVAQAHSLGLKVMFRPLVDVNDGTWRGSITPLDRAAWFVSYRAFIDHYADLAQQLGVGELSLGAEMGSMAGDATSWRALIADVRTRYHGTLTYGANWDDYAGVTWWDALDEIGIDAYMPLAAWGITPDADSIVADWSSTTANWGRHHNYLSELAAFQAAWGKPIKFTEVGYTSTATNLLAPYEDGGIYDGDAQVRAFNALFRAFQDKPWFRGVYIWNWDVWMDMYGPGNTSHPIQNKPAQLSVTNWFANAAVGDATTTPPPSQPLEDPAATPPVVSTTAPTTSRRRALAKRRAAAMRRAAARRRAAAKRHAR